MGLRRWCAQRWPGIDWRVLEHGERGASLVASHGAGPLLYSHLDTSLDRTEHDRWITGRDDPVAAISQDGTYIKGFGLGVARGPAAAALLAFSAAEHGTLLLAGSGTHRRGAGPTGLETFLASEPPVPSAIVAKSGPPGVLYAEPGAAYLTVRVLGRSGVVLLPASAHPTGGVVAQAGRVLDCLSAWCADYVASRAPVGQLAASAGVGAIGSGWLDKPDLLPALLEISLYVGTLPGEDVAALARDLQTRLAAALAETPLGACAVSVDPEQIHAAAETASDAPIVAAAEQAWTDEFGVAPQHIQAWTGSTDGVVLRGAGIDTVRLGPSSVPADDDPRRDRMAPGELAGFERVYRRLLDRS